MPVLAAIVGLFVIVLVGRSALDAAHAGWPLVTLAAVVLTWVALLLWHRRRMHELHELHLVTVGRWRNVHLHHPWPKACRDCGQEVGNWRSARDHDEPDTSPCARYLFHRDALERRPAEAVSPPADSWEADVIEDEPMPQAPALPDENMLRSREWGKLDELIGRTTGRPG